MAAVGALLTALPEITLKDVVKSLEAHLPARHKQLLPSNFSSSRKYQVGEAVDVAYDLSEPWRAYSVREWAAAARDLWFGTAISMVAVFLWILGRVYHLPF